ncbi:nitrate- and nitrite sensing domain-containing protein [Nocardia sp. BMG51109]|uniref:sensor histidine kinase n=1 Tax=Nocardia sp. BMG51109 TaxID=1056816 RepID=UPI0004630FB7|nr:nitrate- and nitrite sensing domain-containing protein [Nocardia sp. BMG51109]
MRPRTIRGQLTRVLVVSVLLALVLLGVIVARQVDAYRDTDTTVRGVSLALSVQDLVHELQRERGLTNGLLGGDAALRQTVDDQRAATDRARLALDSALTADAPGADQARVALERLTALGDTRDRVDARGADRTSTFQFYSDTIGALGRTRSGLEHARDDEIWRGLQALYALGDAKEFTGQERGFLNGVFAAGGFGPGEYVRFLTIRAGQNSALAAFRQDATAGQQARLDTVLHSEDAVRAAEAESVALASDRGPLTQPVAAGDWWARMTAVIDQQRDVQGSVGADIEHRADQLRRTAALQLGAYTGAAMLALFILVLLVVASARAIVRPLAALAGEADDVASRRLPELIHAWQAATDAEPDPPQQVRTPAGASTEIVSVAEAFDRVQVTAYELASQQALLQRNTTESLANLGRRNQNLVRRQLALISEFEREELDPKMLANMFELDHLATRMRRNAESLLVLVGEASPRRWSEPIPLTDVIRAALSEVDDYPRVVLRRVDDVAITGAVVSDLAHMLAELIENGLAFSPPDLEVEIYGRRLGQHYLLAIVDHGVGMSADQLADANARLRGDADFLVAPTRYLGHYVVGRLARRLGIEVELTVSPVSGVVARLLLPLGLLADPGTARPNATPDAAPAIRARDIDGHPATETTSEHAAAEVTQPTFRSTRRALALSPDPAPTTELPSVSTGNAGNGQAPERYSPGRHSLPASRETSANTSAGTPMDTSAGTPSGDPQPDPFPTLPPGPMKDSLYAAAAHRNRAAAAPEAPEPHTPDDTPVAEVQRTRNGLVKRNRKTRDAGARPAVAPRQPAAPAADRSPDQVRGMLTGFRAGHQRGESTERQRIPASTTQEEPR